MTDRQLRLRLGIFALLALVLLATLIVLFGSMPNLFKRANDYTITYADAPGARPGTPVRRSGVRVGEVKDVTFDDDKGVVKVRVEIDKSYTVRRNEVPWLNTSLLGNDASIDFVPEKVTPPEEPDRSPVPPGSVIAGKIQVSVNTLINRAADLAPTTQEVLNDVRKSLQRLEAMAPLLEATANEYRELGHKANEELPALAKSLRGSSDDFGATAREWRKLGENVNVLLLTNQDKVVKALDNVNLVLERVLLTLSDGNVKNITEIIQNVRDVSARAIGITKNLQDAADHAPAIAKNIDEASKDAPAIAKNTREASEHFPSIASNADELTKEARATLARLQQTLAKAEAAMADIQKTTQLFGERGPAITKNLDESLDKLNHTMTDVRELMRVIGQSDGTFKRVLTDPSLYNNIDQTACAIAKLMPRLDRILMDLETFADKLARHPEQIGVPGILKSAPGAGLKEQDPINSHVPH